MEHFYVTTTKDEKPSIVQLVRNLPRILSGTLPDVQGIATGFKSRIGYKVLELITGNFDVLSKGGTGADGDKWHPLSPEYLAYGRRFGPGEVAQLRKQHGVTKGMRYAPGDKKGLLTKEQLKLWRSIYADRLAWYIMRESDSEAKAHAAAVAWIILKSKGAKTKLEVFGSRQVQILVDTARGRGSLQPGTLVDKGLSAARLPYAGKGGPDCVFDAEQTGRILVGTNVGYMGAHHNAKPPRKKRRLWPQQFPTTWWSEILGSGVAGLTHIIDILRGSKPY